MITVRYDGVDMREFAISAYERDSFSSDAMTYTSNSIPGRNGDLLIAENRRGNHAVSIDCVIYEDFYINFSRMRDFLMSRSGYGRLELSNHPDEFFQAAVLEGITPTVWRDADIGRFVLTFSRKPQRFLTSGERKISFSADGTIVNPTYNAARPLLRVYGEGTFGINGVTVTISSAGEYTDIDCEIMEAFEGTESRNQYLSMSSNDFPVLNPGRNGITLGDVDRIEITPRWYRL